jgi:hypothetical protein
MSRTSCLSVLVAALIVTGCTSIPKDAFRLRESALQVREMQTREYGTVSDVQILAASSAVLQDLGYTIDEMEKSLGVLSASKRADARNDMETLGNVAVDVTQCLVTFMLGCDGRRYRSGAAVQDIRLTLVALPPREGTGATSVRVTIQRIVWDHENRLLEQQTIADETIYRSFFDKLSKSVFLEQQGL